MESVYPTRAPGTTAVPDPARGTGVARVGALPASGSRVLVAAMVEWPHERSDVDGGGRMDARVATERGLRRLRRPTAGEALDLVVVQGVMFGVGAAVVGVAGSPALWWVLGAVMLVALVRWVGALLREPAAVPWGAGSPPSYGHAWTQYRAGAGIAGFESAGGGGGGDGGGGGGC